MLFGQRSGQSLDLLIDEAGVDVPGQEVRMLEEFQQKRDIGVEAFDAEFAESP